MHQRTFLKAKPYFHIENAYIHRNHKLSLMISIRASSTVSNPTQNLTYYQFFTNSNINVNASNWIIY